MTDEHGPRQGGPDSPWAAPPQGASEDTGRQAPTPSAPAGGPDATPQWGAAPPPHGWATAPSAPEGAGQPPAGVKGSGL
jgi:hypothetical protein